VQLHKWIPKNLPKYFFKKDKKVVDIEKYFGIIVTAVAKSNKNIWTVSSVGRATDS
jgi:hypothetical protein